MNLKIWIFVCLAAFALSCRISPGEINYGKDQCSACKMIISDSRFGAELVTKKGKIYKFDAIECMVPEVLEKGKDGYAFILVTPFDRPGELVNASEVEFLLSPDVPSPMGRFLSAHLDANRQNYSDAQWFGWPGLLKEFEE
ncbi:MAG: hypothetical protein KDC80_24205 [Saprospiraceae bacterium]|nr:hypothetical protein [Saprospiraceae bacterium]